MQKISPFHLAIPVHDLSIARDFYENKLGLITGRTSDQWADYIFLDTNWLFTKTLSLKATNISMK